jgi:SAM-dependent methyltransferase
MDAWDYWYEKKLGVVEPEVAKLVSLFKRDHLRRALDAGCGIGRHVTYLARHGIEAYGFDTSEKAVSRASTLLREEGLTASLTVGDMFKHFPYDNQFFGGVIATRTIHHGLLNDILKVVSEIDRVLAKGGYLFVQTSAWFPGERIENPIAVEVEPRTLLWSKGEEAHIPHHFFTREELLRIFKNYRTVSLHARSDHYDGWCLLAKKTS